MNTTTMRRAMVAVGLATSVVAGALGTTPARAGTSTNCHATNQFEDAAHTGYNCSDLPVLPRRAWVKSLYGATGAPVVVNGRVLLVGGGWLFALSKKTGERLWAPEPLPGGAISGIAYAHGRVIVNDFDGTLQGYEAKTGVQDWATPTEYFGGAPVAGHGQVWVQDAGDAYGLDPVTGDLLAQSGYLDGDQGLPAITGQGVFLSTGCSSQFRLAFTGQVDWADNSGCSGGGGGIAYVSHKRMYGDDGLEVMRVGDGKVVGTFQGFPAFDSARAYFAVGSHLYAETLPSGAPAWTKGAGATITTHPVVTDRAVYVGTSDGYIVAFDPTTGARLGRLSMVSKTGALLAPETLTVGDNALLATSGSVVDAFH